MHDPTEDDRRRRCIDRAWLIAMSGEVASWREVEARLIAGGWPEAAGWLAGEDLRRKMDETCVKAVDARKLAERR